MALPTSSSRGTYSAIDVTSDEFDSPDLRPVPPDKDTSPALSSYSLGSPDFKFPSYQRHISSPAILDIPGGLYKDAGPSEKWETQHLLGAKASTRDEAVLPKKLSGMFTWWKSATAWIIIVNVALVVFAVLHRNPLNAAGKSTLESLRKLKGASADLGVVCPVPGTSRPSSPMLSRTLSKPYSIDVAGKDFDVSLAYSLTTCNSFRVTIKRTDPDICRTLAHQLVSPNPETQAHITKELGPDTFQVRVDGAERLMMSVPTNFSSATCSYSYDFRVNAPGTLWLGIVHVFDNYDGFYEMHTNETSFVPPLYHALLPTPLQLNLCGQSCPSYVRPILDAPSNVFDVLTVDRDPSEDPTASFPACSGDDPIHGTYVPHALPSVLYPPVPLPHGPDGIIGGLYDFIPTECKWNHDGLRFKDHESCLKKPHKALFWGDSHARGAWDAVRHRMEGNDSIVQLSNKQPMKHAVIGELFLEYSWDPHLEAPHSCDLMQHFDTVVISTGAHQAGFRSSTFTTKTLVKRLEALFESWPRLSAQCGRKTPTKFIYLNTPAYWYPPKHHGLEGRTGPRLEHWNEKLTKLARVYDWAVIDVFSLTKPFAVDTIQADGIHYLKTDAIDPIGDELIGKMGICGTAAKTHDTSRPLQPHDESTFWRRRV
ncbi:hypothetical protein MNV49_000564 [Pseudohyphozyma bogoriensis]|nr:hypothetical protein MNV49_000564 [Pseudohyphozyma bogoriensis]